MATKRTLLTGANSFVASHILDQLILTYGHNVTGSVRSASKGEEVLVLHPEYKGKLDFVVVSDYAGEGVWDQVFKNDGEGFDYVIHVAAPLLDDPRNTDFERDFLKTSVNGATEILKSAKKFGKGVKSVVVTGSVNSMTTGQDVAERVFNSEAWLPLTIEDAIKAQHNYISYCVSKAEAEKAIWKFVEEEKPSFSVTVLLPALIFGPPIQPVSSLKKINFSNDVFYGLFNGQNESLPATPFGAFIDVRDLATAHIKSLTVPEVANKRLLVGGHKYSSQIAVDALKGLPELEGRLVKDGDEVVGDVNFSDVKEWNEKLGLKIRTPEETFRDAAKKILQLEKSMK